MLLTDHKSQTEHGQQNSAVLTRFYARMAPESLSSLIETILVELDFDCRFSPGRLSFLIAGKDSRKICLTGRVELEEFTHGHKIYTFCTMSREKVCSLLTKAQLCLHSTTIRRETRFHGEFSGRD